MIQNLLTACMIATATASGTIKPPRKMLTINTTIQNSDFKQITSVVNNTVNNPRGDPQKWNTHKIVSTYSDGYVKITRSLYYRNTEFTERATPNNWKQTAYMMALMKVEVNSEQVNSLTYTSTMSNEYQENRDLGQVILTYYNNYYTIDITNLDITEWLDYYNYIAIDYQTIIDEAYSQKIEGREYTSRFEIPDLRDSDHYTYANYQVSTGTNSKVYYIVNSTIAEIETDEDMKKWYTKLLMQTPTNYSSSLQISYVRPEGSINYEVVDLPGVMFNILGMPFAFMSTAFNLTIFEGTPYAINISNVILGIFTFLVVLFIVKVVIKNRG